MSRATSISNLGNESSIVANSAGNVGFGSTLPNTKVDIVGNVNVSGVATVSTLSATAISAGSTIGTNNQVLSSTGVGLTWRTLSSGISQVSNFIVYGPTGTINDGAAGRLDVFGQGNIQYFTSPGTFTVNPGISSIRVRVIGAGGNGGQGGTGLNVPTGGTGATGGGGGGGGGYAQKVIPNASFPAPRAFSITVGTAPGGTSSFGALVSATGGGLGVAGNPGSPSPSASISGASGGTGGTGVGGDINYTGATGSSSGPISPGGGSPTGPVPNGGGGGAGGASATQLGNSTGPSVPITNPPSSAIGLTTQTSLISRFPFDIFTGNPPSAPPTSSYNGIGGNPGLNIYLGSTSSAFGAAGGGGGQQGMPSNNAAIPSYYVSTGSGGNGALGGGGGGGGGGAAINPAYVPPSYPPVAGGPGGLGGGGIVIVEW